MSTQEILKCVGPAAAAACLVTGHGHSESKSCNWTLQGPSWLYLRDNMEFVVAFGLAGSRGLTLVTDCFISALILRGTENSTGQQFAADLARGFCFFRFCLCSRQDVLTGSPCHRWTMRARARTRMPTCSTKAATRAG